MVLRTRSEARVAPCELAEEFRGPLESNEARRIEKEERGGVHRTRRKQVFPFSLSLSFRNRAPPRSISLLSDRRAKTRYFKQQSCKKIDRKKPRMREEKN